MFLNFFRFPVFYLFFLMTAVGLRSSAPAAIGGPSGESRINEPPGPAAPVPKIPGLEHQPAVRSVNWDYFENPVKSFSPSSKPEDFVFGTIPLFDGYPARVSQPSIRIYWNGDAPQQGKPVHVDIDYFQPVAVTRFVHYFGRVPRMIPDGANTEINWHGWRETEVFTSSNGQDWALLGNFTLGREFPQVIGIHKPVRARHYRIVIHSMLEKTDRLHSYELETWHGATIGQVEAAIPPVQSEPLQLNVGIHCLDGHLEGASLKITAPDGWLLAEEIPVPSLNGSSINLSVPVIPLVSGVIPLTVTLKSEGHQIDTRPATLRVIPKLGITEILPASATVGSSAPPPLSLTAVVTNNGTTPAAGVRASWLGQNQVLGTLGAGQSAAVNLTAIPDSGYLAGDFEVTADHGVRNIIRRPVISPTGDTFKIATSTLETDYSLSVNEPAMRTTFKTGGTSLSGHLMAFMEDGSQVSLKQTGTASAPLLAGALRRSVLLIRPVVAANGEDTEFECRVVPHDPWALEPSREKFTIRFAVSNPVTLFRPHLDLFDVGEEPKFGWGGWAILSPTRMLAVQNDVGTVSMVPDTDNLHYFFATDSSLNATFDCDLPDPDPMGLGIWQPVERSPREFKLTLPMRPHDWWDSYRHVVENIFGFEQARQWAMPMTKMQMLTTRSLLRQENWSTQFNTMRSFPDADTFYNFYGTTYTIPALYNWFLATDDRSALRKAEAVVEWLLQKQITTGKMAGTWFSQYVGEQGMDQAGNPWLLPHTAGSSSKTLLWYYEASGKTHEKVLAAARRGCDFLVAHQQADGSWPYAFNATGDVVSSQPDAGQIWCSWALWKLSVLTGEQRYLDAALKYKEFFVRNCYLPHRYSGYWEDVSAGGGNTDPALRSTETYEAALAAQYFLDMGDPELAEKVARDSAMSHWTRVTSTRQYETQYGQTVEQGAGGPSQAQSPMSAISAQRIYEVTGDRFWSKLAGAVKAINFCADPETGYGMVAIAGWDENLTGVIAPPYDNSNPLTAPGFGLGRGVWNEWQSSQYSWLALEWLVREGNIRAPHHLKINPLTLRGNVLGRPGRVFMPQDRVDVTPLQHLDVNWTGYRHEDAYMLLLMNHQEKTGVYIRPHHAHLDIQTAPPQVLIGTDGAFQQVPCKEHGVQVHVEIPAQGTALLIWQRIR